MSAHPVLIGGQWTASPGNKTFQTAETSPEEVGICGAQRRKDAETDA